MREDMKGEKGEKGEKGSTGRFLVGLMCQSRWGPWSVRGSSFRLARLSYVS